MKWGLLGYETITIGSQQWNITMTRFVPGLGTCGVALDEVDFTNTSPVESPSITNLVPLGTRLRRTREGCFFGVSFDGILSYTIQLLFIFFVNRLNLDNFLKIGLLKIH